MVFTCLTGFLNKLNEFQQKVHIEIIETNVLNFLTVFADIMLGEEQSERLRIIKNMLIILILELKISRRAISQIFY